MTTRRSIVALVSGFVLINLAASAGATTILVEDFDDVTTLAGSGWTQINNSTLGGSTGWFQGNAGIFPSQQGAPDAYIAANFLNTDIGGNISNWLLTPVLSVKNGDTLTFYTRSAGDFEDRLEVRLSTNGASGDVGGTDASVGDFTTLLVTINPALDGSYPDDWVSFTAAVSGLGGLTDGRFAFRYFVPDTNVNGDYIGIDTVRVDSVPEPSILFLFFLGAAGLARRRAVPRN